MNIIGIGGVAKAGKGSAAATLVKEYDFVEVNFADELKRTCMRLWPLWGEEDLWGDYKEKPWAQYGGLTPRRALQFMGTEVGRALDPDVWVRHFESTVHQLALGDLRYHRTLGLIEHHGAMPVTNFVSSDTRFENEIASIRRMNGRIWKIERPDLNGSTLGDHLNEAWRAHKSEELARTFDADCVIGNIAGLDALARSVRCVYGDPRLKQVSLNAWDDDVNA